MTVPGSTDSSVELALASTLPSRYHLDTDIYGLDGALRAAPEMDETEDFRKRGLPSRAYEAGRFSAKRENGVYHFQELVREHMGEA